MGRLRKGLRTAAIRVADAQDSLLGALLRFGWQMLPVRCAAAQVLGRVGAFMGSWLLLSDDP
jgi:hypothetical protein